MWSAECEMRNSEQSQLGCYVLAAFPESALMIKMLRKQPSQKRPLPFVLVNMAMTADGKIATANRAISSFASQHDHEHLLKLRATADAVMAGARTVDLNRVNMGTGPARFRRLRLKHGLAEFNLRIIVSRSGSI